MEKNENKNKEILWKLLNNKNEKIKIVILEKYRNYIGAIIYKKLEKIGYQHNMYIDYQEIFNETIESIFYLNQEKINKFKLKTLIGYSAVFSTFKYLRKMNNHKNKISFLCGNKTQNFYDIFIEKQFDCIAMYEPSFYEDGLQMLKDFFINLRQETKKEKEINLFAYKILVLKTNGLTNSEIASRLKVTRRKVYDCLKRWLEKYGDDIKKYLCFN